MGPLEASALMATSTRKEDLGYPLKSTENSTEIVIGKPLHWGFKRKRVAKHSDFGLIEGCMSEAVQGMR